MVPFCDYTEPVRDWRSFYQGTLYAYTTALALVQEALGSYGESIALGHGFHDYEALILALVKHREAARVGTVWPAAREA